MCSLCVGCMSCSLSLMAINEKAIGGGAVQYSTVSIAMFVFPEQLLLFIDLL